MHPRLTELLAYADRTRDDLLALVGAMSTEQWSAVPPGGGWSVAQHVAHLHLVEQSSVRALFRAFRDARAAGLAMESETSSLLGALDHTGLAEARTRIAAPDIVNPVDAPDVATMRERLAASREGLRSWAREADGYALGAVTFPHPRLGALTLYEWVVMIADHEKRHMRHIRALSEPGAA